MPNRWWVCAAVLVMGVPLFWLLCAVGLVGAPPWWQVRRRAANRHWRAVALVCRRAVGVLVGVTPCCQ